MPVLANVGLPMLFIQWELMAVAFLPVVVMETLLLKRASDLKLRQATKDVAVANFWSTLVGLPLAWATMLAVEIVSGRDGFTEWRSPVQMLAEMCLRAAWLVPDTANLFWMVPLAAILLLVPSFVFSVLIEAAHLRRRWTHLARRRLTLLVVRANVYSYLCLFAFGCFWLYFSTQ